MAGKADLCAKALTEARRLAGAREFGPLLGQLFARVDDLLDQIDELSLHLNSRDGAIQWARSLRRKRDAIVSLMPQSSRSLRNGN